MTAVHPFFVSTGVSSKESASSVNSRPRTARFRKIEVVSQQEIRLSDSLTSLPLSDDIESRNEAVDSNCAVDDLRFHDEEFAEVGAMKTNMTIFLRFMMLYGVYFSSKSGNVGSEKKRTDGQEQGSSTTENVSGVGEKSTDGSRLGALLTKVQKIYTYAVTIYLWLTAIRFLTIFNSNDSLNATLFFKLMNLVWTFQVAVSQTSIAVACQSGRLDSILSDVRITVDFTKFVRRRTITSVVGASVFLCCLGTYYLYVLVFARNSEISFNFFFAPFYTYIPVGDQTSIALRVVFISFGGFILSGWVLPLALNHLLALILSRQFRLLYDRFSAAIDPETGSFDGSIRFFRRRHQKLCNAVRNADYFMKIGFVAGFLGHMTNVILCLFALVTIPMTDATSITGFVGALGTNWTGLCIAAIDGVLINSSVSGCYRLLEISLRR